MNTVRVQKIGESSFEVTVDGGTTTRHVVTVSAADVSHHTRGRFTDEDLVYASFRFLLDREPNTSILRRFDLREIGRYFPEYEAEIAAYLEQ